MDAERTTPRCAPGDALPRPAELCAWLTDATPAERTEMVLRLIAAHPQERLDLEQDGGEPFIPGQSHQVSDRILSKYAWSHPARFCFAAMPPWTEGS